MRCLALFQRQSRTLLGCSLQFRPVPWTRQLHSTTPTRRPNDTATIRYEEARTWLDTGVLAERQLAQLYESDYFEQTSRSTEHVRRHVRKPSPVVLEDVAPWLTFAKYVKDHLQSIDFVRECMKAFNKRLAELRPKDALTEIQHVKLGQECLHWMLRSPQEVQDSCGWDLEILAFLAHFLIAEREAIALWKAVREQLVRPSPTTNRKTRTHYANQFSWCGRLLGQIIRAHFAQDVSNSGNEALRSYFVLENNQSRYPSR